MEIVDFPITNGDLPQLCQSLPEGRSPKISTFFFWGTDSPLALGSLILRASAMGFVRLPVDGGHPQSAQSPTSKACIDPDP